MAEDDTVVEQTLQIVGQVHVFKVPPRTSSAGFKCGEWKVVDKMWSGRMRIVALGKVCEIRLEDVNSGQLFATCPLTASNKDAVVEGALDSSRYFILRIENEGRHAFIGLGFDERADAFDFNVALSDFVRHTRAEDEPPSPKKDRSDSADSSSGVTSELKAALKKISKFTLGDGQSLSIKIPGMKSKARSSMQKSESAPSFSILKGPDSSSLPPPPSLGSSPLDIPSFGRPSGGSPPSHLHISTSYGSSHGSSPDDFSALSSAGMLGDQNCAPKTPNLPVVGPKAGIVEAGWATFE